MAKMIQEPEAFLLTEEILGLLQGSNSNAALAALNYCMALIIHQQMGGDELALALSDEQTRECVKLFRGERMH